MRLAARIWSTYALVRMLLAREQLPEVVRRLVGPAHAPRPQPVPRLSRGVGRALRVGRRRPVCLVSALVLFRLLRRQGDAAELVIGLPGTPQDQTAHAWVELDGRDVGPPPGRLGHVEMARYP